MSTKTPKTPGKNGGARPGAGHPSNRETLAKTDPELLAALESRLLSAAPKAAAALESYLADPGANPAQVAAAKYLLDRALGRPRASAETPEQRAIEQELQRLRIASARAEVEERRLRIALLRREAEGSGLTLDMPDYDPLAEPKT